MVDYAQFKLYHHVNIFPSVAKSIVFSLDKKV